MQSWIGPQKLACTSEGQRGYEILPGRSGCLFDDATLSSKYGINCCAIDSTTGVDKVESFTAKSMTYPFHSSDVWRAPHNPMIENTREGISNQ
jgi:hypothetical protein